MEEVCGLEWTTPQRLQLRLIRVINGDRLAAFLAQTVLLLRQPKVTITRSLPTAALRIVVPSLWFFTAFSNKAVEEAMFEGDMTTSYWRDISIALPDTVYQAPKYRERNWITCLTPSLDPAFLTVTVFLGIRASCGHW